MTFKHRPGGFGKRRTQGLAQAPKLTTEVRPRKTIVQSQKRAAVTRNDPKFTEPPVTRTLKAKDLYIYRQIGATVNWEDTIFTKSFAIVFHNGMESLPVPEEGYAICIMDLTARQYRDLSTYAMFLGIEIRHKDLDSPICLPYIPILQLNQTMILDQLRFLRKNHRHPNILGSNEFEVDLRFIKQLTGSGVKPGIKVDFKGLSPNNVSKFCLPIAILQGIAYLDYQAHKTDQKLVENWRDLSAISDHHPSYKGVQAKVKEVLRAAGLIPEGSKQPKQEQYTIEDVRTLQKYYAHQYQIVVFAEIDNKKPIFVGETLMGSNIIPLLCKDGHYQLINSLSAFVGKKYYCVDCKVGYTSLLQHYNCPLRCRLCNLFGCQAEDGVEIKCEDCKVTFYSEQCEQNHRKPLEKGSKTTICGSTLYCADCDTTYRKQKSHECRKAYCQVCRVYRPKGHSCIMSAKHKAGGRSVTQKLIFVQVKFELVRDEEGLEQQKPIMAMALRCCADCRGDLSVELNEGAELTCDKCSGGERRLRFFSDINSDEPVDVLSDLFTFLICKQHERFCVVFHDMPDCVNEFLLSYVTSDGNIKANHIQMMAGRLRRFNLDGLNIRIVDSKNLFPFPLRKLAEGTRVHIPFKPIPQSLIRAENLNYVGIVPKIDVFLEEAEGAEEKQLIVQYHKHLVRNPYVLLNELLSCTYHDVLLLAGSILTIDSEAQARLGVRLVEETGDLLSAALLAYRRTFFTDGVLSLDVGIGHRYNTSGSLHEMEYLAWRSHAEQLPIDSSMNVGEYRLPETPYCCDGFIHPCEKYPRGLVLEIHGCYWHAHGCSLAPMIVPRRELDLPKIKRQDSTKKAAVERLHDFEVVWECEIAQMRTHPEVVNFLSTFVYEGPVEVLAAVYPLRSETFCHTAEADEEYEIRVCDITSLAGRVLLDGEYPACEMRRIHGELFSVPIQTAEELGNQVKGIVYCHVLAPSSLINPVLPDNVNGRVAYHLCKACFEAGDELCDHPDRDRVFRGTWTTFELENALEQGYIITKVIGAIHWDQWSSYEKLNGVEKETIFSQYAKVLLEIEETARGKAADAGDFGTKKRNELVGNTAEALMKLADKFGLRSDHPTTAIVDSRSGIWKLLEDPTMLVHEIKTTPKNKLLVSSGNKSVVLDSAGQRTTPAKPVETTVSIVPALVGGQQRTQIYRAVTQDDCELLYLDESQVVYRCPRGSNPLRPLGPDQFPAVQFRRFSSTGTGNFALEADSGGQIVVKTTGFERKGTALLARGEAIQRQTELLVQGQAECVAVEYVAINANAQHILTNGKGIRRVHTSSPYARRSQSDSTTIPIGFVW